MKQSEKFSIYARIKSFGFAFRGIFTFFKYEHNARIHLFATISVMLLGFYFSISRTEWMFVFSAIGFVVISEMFNTAIEKFADRLTLEYDESIKIIKDVAAGAVLFAAFYALLIAGFIFVPRIFEM
jgi:diacylglycerol kinase (ATP)